MTTLSDIGERLILEELQAISEEMKEVKAMVGARKCCDCGRPIIGEVNGNPDSVYCKECSC